MSYAVRNDRQGFRAVNGPEDVGPGEFFSEEPIEIRPPAPTYHSELAALNAEYQADVDKFNRSFAVAYLSDGPSQETKQATIRAQYEVRKTQHAENVAALKTRYGI